MKKDDYKTNLEEERKEIDLPDGEEIQSRVELHGKSHKKSSRFSLANVLLIIFTLIPISILVFVFISLNFLKDPVTPQAEEDGDEIQFETVGKSDDEMVMTNQEDQEKKDQEKKDQEKKEREKKEKEEQEKKEQQEKEAREKEEAKKKEEERKQEEERKKEEARKQEEARQQELARQQAQKEKEQAEANKNQNQNQSNQSGAKTHTVAPGETLYRISVNYYQTGDGVNKIRQANGLSSNEISVGQTLIIP